MVTVSMETADGSGDYLYVNQLWWCYPSMRNLLGLGQSPWKRFCRTKTFWVKMANFRYFGSYLKAKRPWVKIYKKC